MAIGIVSFAFVSIFGMIPVGLTSFRNAMNASIGSQIVQQVVTDLQQTSFKELTQDAASAQDHFRFFDDQGIQVGDPTKVGDANAVLTAAEKAKVIYQAKIVVQTGTTALSSPSLATIMIDVVKNPGANKALAKDSATSGVLQQPEAGIFVSRYFAFQAGSL